MDKQSFRRNVKLTAAAVLLASVVAMSGCSGRNVDQGAGAGRNVPANQGSESNRPEANAAAKAEEAGGQPKAAAESDHAAEARLVPLEIPPYDGTLQISKLDGQPYEASFSWGIFEPWGVYIPSEVIQVHFEDGSEWSFDGEYSTFSIFEESQVLLHDLNYTNPALAEYADYIGSVNDGEVRYEDFLSFEGDGRTWIVRLSYAAEAQDKVLPVFLQMMKSIRYTGSPTNFETGVPVGISELGDEEERDILLVFEWVLNGLADKNKKMYDGQLAAGHAEALEALFTGGAHYRFERVSDYNINGRTASLQVEASVLELGAEQPIAVTYQLTLRHQDDGKWKLEQFEPLK